MTVKVFDTTLRDGAQREGITYSVADKLAVARLLDEFGVAFIEGGWPGAMPKDTEFFARARTELDLRHAALVAFGSTRKAGVDVRLDKQIEALVAAETPVVCLVAKSDIRHVERALRTTADENLAMIEDSVAYLRGLGRRVMVDCEHFFDGFRNDADYGARVVATAARAGAEVVVLCDTNGGMVPSWIGAAIGALRDRLPADVAATVELGIHCQNDTSCAVANTIAAVEAGVSQVQCTANGYGERPGNADLFAVVANLELKLGMRVLPEGCLPQAVRVSHAIAEIANLAPDTHQAYVGAAAFAHKAGLHASAIKVDPLLYNHIEPDVVGNDMKILVTEMAGRASIELKSRELGLDLSAQPDALSKVTNSVKELEAAGWSFEAADASFELLVRSALPGGVVAPFHLESYRVIVEHRGDGEVVSEATVKLRVRGERVISTAEGNGPVNALDNALRSGLRAGYPDVDTFELADYKVRILAGPPQRSAAARRQYPGGTGAITRVLVDTAHVNADGAAAGDWTTVGVHENVVEASWHALVDALTYGLVAASPGGTQRAPRSPNSAEPAQASGSVSVA